jgi:hypothetical protein
MQWLQNTGLQGNGLRPPVPARLATPAVLGLASTT